MDFLDVASGRRLPPVSPGKTICVMSSSFTWVSSVYELANAIDVFLFGRANVICRPMCGITADTAMRFGFYGFVPLFFAEFWINLQPRDDLDVARTAPCCAKSSARSRPETQPDWKLSIFAPDRSARGVGVTPSGKSSQATVKAHRRRLRSQGLKLHPASRCSMCARLVSSNKRIVSRWQS